MRRALQAVVIAAMLTWVSMAGFAQNPAADATTAPDVTLQTLKGEQLSLSGLRGKAVALNFWATWCTPCRTEMPWLIEMQKKYAADGLQVIGISMDDPDSRKVRPFLAQIAVNYPVAFGTPELADAFGQVQSLPVTFLITPAGKISKKLTGVQSREQLESELLSLLGKDAPH